MSDAQKLIADVMAEHQFSWGSGGTSCSGKGCRDWRGYPVQHRQHLAAEIDKALGGLRPDLRHGGNYHRVGTQDVWRERSETRWVSGWKEAGQ